jgi:deazaflavin-dependent oxidoreductase (nitroreductase family)
MLAVIRPIINPLMMRLGMMAVVHHRGRHTGRAYVTPTAARPTAGGFVIPMTFGEQADWFRNLREADGGVIEWKGARYPVVDPVIVKMESVRASFAPAERVMLGLMGMENFVRLRHAPPGSA